MTTHTTTLADDGHRVARQAFVAALGIAVIAFATLTGAWFFQLVLKIMPCELCLEQRYAYYAAIPLAIVLAIAGKRNASRRLLMGGLALLALIVFANAGLGAYHAGVEWGWWPGPSACTGSLAGLGTGNLLDSLNGVKLVRCDEVQWRFLGLSLAGYNVLISLAMAVIALWGIGETSRRAP